MNIMGTIFDVD